jgi:hypothetical protein
MGGIFSGSWTRDNCKSTVESRNSVSVKYLKEQGCLNEGISGTLSWSRNGEQCGSIGYRVKANGIQFNYRSRTSDYAEWENVELFIQFDYTACNYGNQRTWLLCPHCHKRVGVVYSEGKYFLCRKCSQLNYQSQHENHFERQQTKAQKIRQKLGGHFSSSSHFPDKPKGMHWQTYWQLQSIATWFCYAKVAAQCLTQSGKQQQ